ncbi:MAG: cyclic lactone autoinducer peptide [Desulfotomaculales bacterium]
MLRRTGTWLAGLLAGVLVLVAQAGVGPLCTWGWYQPETPRALRKQAGRGSGPPLPRSIRVSPAGGE